jgi:multimeric flavodoxin WrbA
MKKVIVLNGSPRKKWNTAQILKAAADGAKSVGAEVEYIDLYDLSFTDCRSCLACKRKGIAEPCKCYWKDDISPVIERIYKADALIVGSPIYYGEPTGVLRSFLVRCTFPAMSYNDYSSTFGGKVDVAAFLTMNAPKEMYDKMYEQKMKEYFFPFRFLNGKVSVYPVCDTLQVSDYSKFELKSFNEEHKKHMNETDFQEALETAFRIGAEMGA